jgi:branched-subunit amino acid permease
MRTAAILSLVVFLFVRKNFPGVKLMIVVAIIAGLADQIIVSFWGSTMPKTFPSYQLGTAWFIPMFIGPIMMVACFNAAESVYSTIHF